MGFFFALELVDLAAGYAWNLLPLATGIGGTGWSVQPKAPVHWHRSMFKCMLRAHGQTRARWTHVRTTTTTTTTRRFSQELLVFCGDLQRRTSPVERAWRRDEAAAATTVLMVATRAAVDRCGPGLVSVPLCPTGTEDGQDQGRGGERNARRPAGTEDTPSGGAAGSLAEPGPQRSDRSLRHSQGMPSRPSACPHWLGLRERQWTLPPSPSSQPKRWWPIGRRRRKGGGGGSRK